MNKITINGVELASELAHMELMDKWSESIQIHKDEEAEVLEYTEEAQDLFDEFYDQYLTLIENTKI